MNGEVHVRLDASVVGTRYPATTLLMTRDRLRRFAVATGQREPIYTDVEAARRAGHPDLPVPPTFIVGIEFESADPFHYLTDQGVDLQRVLHGEQHIICAAVAHAGDTLTSQSMIADVYERKEGALGFIVRETVVTDQRARLIATMRNVAIVRNNQPAVLP
jgi:acyl dehydratase